MSAPVSSAKRPILLIAVAVFTAAAAYVGYLAWRASKDIVTLHVRNEPLPSVMKSLRWQTWETFKWHKDISANITLDVDDMPLEQALEIIAEQTSSRWTALYPIYRGKAALASLDEALAGKIEPSKSSFTNLQSRGFPGRGGGPGGFGGGPMPGPFGDTVLAQNNLVSLQLTNKDIAIAAAALSRFARAQVLPENGVSAKVNLTLSQVPFDKAVASVAKGVKRSWTKLYALQPVRGGPDFAAGRGPRGERGPGGPERFAGFSEEQRERMRQRSSELLDTLPPEQRKEAEERRALMQEVQNLPEDQRRALMEARMNSPEMQQRQEQRMASNIRNSTPEQRRERYERMSQMRKARAAGLQPPGGPRGR